jgi:hypothetical protein
MNPVLARFRQAALVVFLAGASSFNSVAMQISLNEAISGPQSIVNNWRERLGTGFHATLLVNQVDMNALEHYGMSIFIYNLDAGHYGDNTRNLWSREDCANGLMLSGAQVDGHVPQTWRDFGFGILLATVDSGVCIGLSPDPSNFSVYQGTGGVLDLNGQAFRWDHNSYLLGINSPGLDGSGFQNLIVHVAVPDSGVGAAGLALVLLAVFACHSRYRASL